MGLCAQQVVGLVDRDHAIGSDASFFLAALFEPVRMITPDQLPVGGFDLIAGAGEGDAEQQARTLHGDILIGCGCRVCWLVGGDRLARCRRSTI